MATTGSGAKAPFYLCVRVASAMYIEKMPGLRAMRPEGDTRLCSDLLCSALTLCLCHTHIHTLKHAHTYTHALVHTHTHKLLGTHVRQQSLAVREAMQVTKTEHFRSVWDGLLRADSWFRWFAERKRDAYPELSLNTLASLHVLFKVIGVMHTPLPLLVCIDVKKHCFQTIYFSTHTHTHTHTHTCHIGRL